MLSEQREEVPGAVCTEECQVEAERDSWRRGWHVYGSLNMG